MKLLPASHFTIEALTDAYNATRVDYIVPMPMSVARLQSYIDVYDVDLSASCVVVEGETVLGLGLLGSRDRRAWITRLGVIPSARRHGVGVALMDGLMASARAYKHNEVWLEVIKGNAPAHALFHRYGFADTRELLIVRRPPNADLPRRLAVIEREEPHVRVLGHEEALQCLENRRRRPNWLNETASLRHVRNLLGLSVSLPGGEAGWAVYHAGLMQLTRLIVEVSEGDAARVTKRILEQVHNRHASQDTIIENIPEDERWPGFEALGYFETFRRIEMSCPL